MERTIVFALELLLSTADADPEVEAMLTESGGSLQRAREILASIAATS